MAMLQRNKKSFKMKKTKVGFQIDAARFRISASFNWPIVSTWGGQTELSCQLIILYDVCLYMSINLKTDLKKSAHVIMDVVDGSHIIDELIWRSLQNGRS